MGILFCKEKEVIYYSVKVINEILLDDHDVEFMSAIDEILNEKRPWKCDYGNCQSWGLYAEYVILYPKYENLFDDKIKMVIKTLFVAWDCFLMMLPNVINFLSLIRVFFWKKGRSLILLSIFTIKTLKTVASTVIL